MNTWLRFPSSPAAIALLASLTLVACGDKKPAKSPESGAGITETSAKEDMPPPPAKDGDPNATTPASGGAGGADAKGPAGGVIKVAAMKLSPAKKGKNDKSIELKDDGTVNIDGKPAAKIKGDQVDSTAGTSMLTVGIDGSLVGSGVKPGLKFEGDDVVAENGTKLSVGDDGTITATTKEGKTETLGKAEGGASAKRAALIVAVLWMSMPAEPAATTGTAPTTKGAKKDDKKDATKKDPAASGKKQKKK